MVLEQCWVGYYPSYNNADSGIFLPRTRWTWVFFTIDQSGLGCFPPYNKLDLGVLHPEQSGLGCFLP